jgi:hypothetical protein
MKLSSATTSDGPPIRGSPSRLPSENRLGNRGWSKETYVGFLAAAGIVAHLIGR